MRHCESDDSVKEQMNAVNLLKFFRQERSGDDTYYLAGIEDSIRVVEQMESESISRHSLRKAGYVGSNVNSDEFVKVSSNGDVMIAVLLNVTTFTVEIRYSFNDAVITPMVNHMDHLKVLEELFL